MERVEKPLRCLTQYRAPVPIALLYLARVRLSRLSVYRCCIVPSISACFTSPRSSHTSGCGRGQPPGAHSSIDRGEKIQKIVRIRAPEQVYRCEYQLAIYWCNQASILTHLLHDTISSVHIYGKY